MNKIAYGRGKRGRCWLVRRERDEGVEDLQCFRTEAEAKAFINSLGEACVTFVKHPTLLADKPHPKLPGTDLTARDYASWLLNNAKYPGLCRAIDMIMEAKERMPRYGGNVIEFPLHRRRAYDGPGIRQA